MDSHVRAVAQLRRKQCVPHPLGLRHNVRCWGTCPPATEDRFNFTTVIAVLVQMLTLMTDKIEFSLIKCHEMSQFVTNVTTPRDFRYRVYLFSGLQTPDYNSGLERPSEALIRTLWNTTFRDACVLIENAGAGAESCIGHARHEQSAAVEDACLCKPQEVHGEE